MLPEWSTGRTRASLPRFPRSAKLSSTCVAGEYLLFSLGRIHSGILVAPQTGSSLSRKTHTGPSSKRREPLYFSNPVRAPYLPLRSFPVSAAMMSSSAPCRHSSAQLSIPYSLPSLSPPPAPPCASTPASLLASFGRLRPAPWPHPVVGNRLLPGPETKFFSISQFVSLCLSQPSKKLISRNRDQALAISGVGCGICVVVWLWGLGFLTAGYHHSFTGLWEGQACSRDPKY